ncbi:GMC family oxidoreductase [Mesorhizobium sp. VK25A]|uniref:GMC family oxidoreductase n=1 Tax=Mesorhizobium vachelliae TaxID=3072309 RepID=A0ABU5AAD2_9HYPH|nr:MULTISPECIES: GMC family oxidoreductase [unclassified Mesorhizobium]MDX8534127.1 GMC family oxidoreductase [Mesorhizobium sp. VK25D]MDX8546696.1 GMC family oxidoreductase [Mesorhizobium sp. VK25A]
MTKAIGGHNPSADVVIVGGGSAGSLLAARLSEEPARRVMLIEAGEEESDPDIRVPAAWPALQGRSYDWNYPTEPQKGTAGRVHRWARGRLIGGSSCLHAMGYMRGHPSDFQAWVEVTGDRRWSWDELLPSFLAIEDHPLGGSSLYGKGGPMPVYLPSDHVSPVARAFIEAGASLGLPRLEGHNSGQMIGVTPNSLNIRDGRRVTVADAWLTPIVRSRGNLTVLTGSQVRRLTLDGNQVRSLEIVGPHGSPLEVLADQVVLCAGALESPALLMRSGIGPHDTLEAAGVGCLIDMPEIGRNLQDHLLGAGNLYAARKPIPPSRLQHSESMAYMRAAGFTGTGQPEIVVGCGVAPIVSERFEAPAAGTAYSLLFGITHPTSRGSVRISGPELDDRLIIDPAYLQTGQDRKLFRQALEAAREIGHRDELADWRERELLPAALNGEAEIDNFIAQSVITHHHPCGTCRMGKDAGAVVDPNLRLKALDNLFVVDASIMPSLTAGPIHAAVLAIAETFARTMNTAH